MLKFLVLLSITFVGQFSLASFSVTFSKFDVVVVNTDGSPMSNMRIQYRTSAKGSGTCGGHRGSPFDFGKPCEITYNPEGEGEIHYALTDANGRATIPAISISGGLTARDPILQVSPVGAEVLLPTPHGVYKCMPIQEAETSWNRNDSRTIDENVSKDLSRTTLKFTYIDWDKEYNNISYQVFLQKAQQLAVNLYARNGDNYVGDLGDCHK